MYKTTTAIVIFLLIGYILYLTQCKKYDCPPAKPQVKTIKVRDTSGWTKPKPDTFYDLDIQYVPVKVPGPSRPVFVDVPRNVYVPVQLPIDTQGILKDYFRRYYYKDSFTTSYGKIYVEDTVTKNRIQARKYTTDFRLPSKTSYRELYWEIGGYNSKTALLSGATVGLGYINRKGQHLKISLNYSSNQLHRGLVFGDRLIRW